MEEAEIESVKGTHAELLAEALWKVFTSVMGAAWLSGVDHTSAAIGLN